MALCFALLAKRKANVMGTVPKPVLDILAEMIAADSDLNVGPFSSGPASDRGLD
jgi:hypothetical protein